MSPHASRAVAFWSSIAKDQHGVALALVMGPLAVAAIIAVSITSATRTLIAHDRASEQGLRRHLDQQSAIDTEIGALLSRDPRAWPPIDGVARTIMIGRAEVAVSLASETAKININHQPNPALQKLLELSCLSPAEAAALARRIADYVDEDDIGASGVSERQEYSSAGLPYGPANARFATTDALRRVPGMSSALLERIREHVTAYTYSAAPDLRFASPLVRLAVLGRHAAPMSGNENAAPSLATPPTGFITITARLKGESAGIAETIYLTGRDTRPILVMERQTDSPNLSGSEACDR